MLRIHGAGHRQEGTPEGRYFHNRRQAKRSLRKVWQPPVRCLKGRTPLSIRKPSCLSGSSSMCCSFAAGRRPAVMEITSFGPGLDGMESVAVRNISEQFIPHK
jgi:hypothetical protein